ncbi:hypothetical protein A1Q1_04502 [Trichosporon asahii var. asahii CBS 2479]|uniref:Uncharacterized protein n=1 Tax=Trichosporon asahii var. asahii (strain ATCC 90039 / CBS 2479 / JCM 2466 / KCTC 7840 / NBRC 103889/ NCYC 2677 / UAMH 7654) TaxID=1186058 RepID=J6EQJ7_TRIAS|nr:hypothetical protein A1Q1_04502 [Trichosporon asahii var. asahii CBS 2479]EJT46759.1 hypothetical protein A1Q1_04502 [Trichosporon asahii var. asahii CBS 2479]
MTLASLPFVYGYLTGGIERMWYLGNNGWTRHLADVVVAFFGTYLFLATHLHSPPEKYTLTPSRPHDRIRRVPETGRAADGLDPPHRLHWRDGALRDVDAVLRLPDCEHHGAANVRSGHLQSLPGGAQRRALPHPNADHAHHFQQRAAGGCAAPLLAEDHGGLARAVAKAAAAEAKAAAEEKEAKEAKRPPHLELGGSTPEDSPLVTPYAAPADAFIIPGVGPLPAIPTLSSLTEALPQAKANLSALHSEFSAAVHARLEEQRERLAMHGFLRRRAVYAEDNDDEMSD